MSRHPEQGLKDESLPCRQKPGRRQGTLCFFLFALSLIAAFFHLTCKQNKALKVLSGARALEAVSSPVKMLSGDELQQLHAQQRMEAEVDRVKEVVLKAQGITKFSKKKASKPRGRSTPEKEREQKTKPVASKKKALKKVPKKVAKEVETPG